VRPLVAVRRAAPFDPGFLARDALLWPLSRAANALHGYTDFPPPEALAAVFEGAPPVRFVGSVPRRRRRAPVDPRTLYDARVTLDREVPTRAGCWHDLMNALVWGTFPLAKGALHARQYRALSQRIGVGARTLPAARTPELDALALLDEGGVVTCAGTVEGARIVFGHAVYESLVLGVRPAIVAGLTLAADPTADDPNADQRWGVVRAVDRALAAAIDDPMLLRTPRDLRRVSILAAAGVVP
jgi:Protein of unknown function (DUF3025)